MFQGTEVVVSKQFGEVENVMSTHTRVGWSPPVLGVAALLSSAALVAGSWKLDVSAAQNNNNTHTIYSFI